MKTFAALAAALAIAAPAGAQQIERLVNPQPGAIILQGVTIPPGAEVAMLSGQLASPVTPGTQDYGDTKTQTISILNKIKALLEGKGWKMSDIVKLTVFVTAAPGMDGKMDFAGFNAGYRQFFGTPENPNLVARSTVQVAGLAGPGFLIEIEATAARLPARKK